jgi:hypothetical protein
MRVLNIDLDFFLNNRVTMQPDDPDNRPDEEGLIPWKAAVVEKYLRTTLNLQGKVPGRVVQSHDEVFYHWRELIASKKLLPPFFVCHVDAHSDLGMGTPSWIYLHSDFLELPLVARPNPTTGSQGLNFANYMAFAAGNRWFTEIDFVAPKCWHDDIPRFMLSDDSPGPTSPREEFYQPNSALFIELMHVPRNEIESRLYTLTSDWFRIRRRSVGEPRIPLNIIAASSVGKRYWGQSWNYVYLSHSPGYTPTSADALIPVISKHIDQI